jgi:hypothetical protein
MEFDSLSEMYSREKYQQYARERYHKLDNYCSKCVVSEYCHGNCPIIDIDENGTAGEPNTYSCAMIKLNLICAYRALLQADINHCHRALRGFVIDKCVFLPQEIPTLLEKLGIRDKFGELNFTNKTANFGSKEFKLFQAINPPRAEEWLENGYSNVFDGFESEKEDDRFERAYKLLQERAERVTEELLECEDSGE